MKKLVLLLLLVMSLQAKILFFGRGNTLTVTVSPPTATIPYNQPQTITATLQGKGGAQGVQWSTSAGTLVGATSGTNSVSFIPPMGCGVATVMAIAKANTTVTAKATITVIQIAPLAVRPASANITAGQSVQFNATGGCPAKF